MFTIGNMDMKETDEKLRYSRISDILELLIQMQSNVLGITLSDIQSIITTTDLKNISKKIVDNSAIFYVKNGIVERK